MARRGDPVNRSGPIHPPLAPVGEPEAAELARALLAEADQGIRRLCFVGLAERVGVHLLVAAHEQGLESRTTRGAGGQLTIVLAAPAPATVAPPAPADPTVGWLARCRRVLARVGERVATRLRSNYSGSQSS
jgi:hypothetical protein